jgi:hypothetical protein
MSEELDINDPSLVNEPVETDGGSGDEFFAVRLPDDGEHLVRLALGSAGIKAGRQDASKGGKPFITVHLAETIYDANNEPQGMVFDRPNSAVFERNGKRTSRLHAVMDLIDAPFATNATIPDQVATVEGALADQPAIVAVTQWQASAKAETDADVEKAIAAKYAKAGKLAVGQYYTFVSGQKRFPLLDTDPVTYDPEVENPITGEKVRAQAIVIRYKRA